MIQILKAKAKSIIVISVGDDPQLGVEGIATDPSLSFKIPDVSDTAHINSVALQVKNSLLSQSPGCSL